MKVWKKGRWGICKKGSVEEREEGHLEGSKNVWKVGSFEKGTSGRKEGHK